MDKTTPDKTFQTKDPLTNPPGQKPRKQLSENLYRGFLSEFFVLGLLKNRAGGSEMCDVLLGGPGMCDKVWQGGGKNWPKIAWRTLWTAPLLILIRHFPTEYFSYLYLFILQLSQPSSRHPFPLAPSNPRHRCSLSSSLSSSSILPLFAAVDFCRHPFPRVLNLFFVLLLLLSLFPFSALSSPHLLLFLCACLSACLFFFLFLCVSMSLCLSLFLYTSVSLSLPLFFFLFLTTHLSISSVCSFVFVSLSVSLPPSLFLSLYLIYCPIHFFLFLSFLSFSFCIFFSFCLCLSLLPTFPLIGYRLAWTSFHPAYFLFRSSRSPLPSPDHPPMFNALCLPSTLPLVLLFCPPFSWFTTDRFVKPSANDASAISHLRLSVSACFSLSISLSFSLSLFVSVSVHVFLSICFSLFLYVSCLFLFIAVYLFLFVFVYVSFTMLSTYLFGSLSLCMLVCYCRLSFCPCIFFSLCASLTLSVSLSLLEEEYQVDKDEEYQIEKTLFVCLSVSGSMSVCLVAFISLDSVALS